MFPIYRSPNPQLPFGVDEHFCLDANLAQRSLRDLFTELLAAIESITLDAPPRWLQPNLISGVKEMRISYDVR